MRLRIWGSGVRISSGAPALSSLGWECRWKLQFAVRSRAGMSLPTLRSDHFLEGIREAKKQIDAMAPAIPTTEMTKR